MKPAKLSGKACKVKSFAQIAANMGNVALTPGAKMPRRKLDLINRKTAEITAAALQASGCKTWKEAKSMLGVSSIGAVSASAKLMHSERVGVDAYGIYLSPADGSGYNVCPEATHCRAACLASSGLAKVEDLAGLSKIQSARVKRTRLLFENRAAYVAIVVKEICAAIRRAARKQHAVSVRINCTSDVSPLLYKIAGLQIHEIFKPFGVYFYDYTKVPAYTFNGAIAALGVSYTLSFNGYNQAACKQYLEAGGNVAMVFRAADGSKLKNLPEAFQGFKVIDGDITDFRPSDPRGVIVGLRYKENAKDIAARKSGEIIDYGKFVVTI